jgi:hypothetical protein
MGASSVTGVSGAGDSHGKFKPENSGSCGCGGGGQTVTPAVKVRKSVCSVSYQSQGTAHYRVTSNVRAIRVC